jgi:hypothetical protein
VNFWRPLLFLLAGFLVTLTAGLVLLAALGRLPWTR